MENKTKRLRAKQICKHELEVNWLKSSYIPEQGEIVVYDAEVDEGGNILELPSGRQYPYNYAREKIGDGIHPINELSFVIDTQPIDMKELDRIAIAEGRINESALQNFNQKFERVYTAQSKNRGQNNKIALTSHAELGHLPQDFDVYDTMDGAQPYYLGSIPVRLGGTNDARYGDSTLWQVGHIRVPSLSVDDFPTNAGAESFAVSKKYVDSAIEKINTPNHEKELDSKAYTRDNKFIYLDSHEGVNSQIYFQNTRSIPSDKTICSFAFSTYLKYTSTTPNNEFYLWGYEAETDKSLYYFMITKKGQITFVQYKPDGTIARSSYTTSLFVEDKWLNVQLFYQNNLFKLRVDNEDVISVIPQFVIQQGGSIKQQISASKGFQGTIKLSNIAFVCNIDESENSSMYKNLNERQYTLINGIVGTNKNSVIYQGGSTDKWEVMDADITDEDYTGYEIVNRSTMERTIEGYSILKDKKILYHGDSICEERLDPTKLNYNGGGYAKIISNLTGSSYVNYAKSGSVFVSSAPKDEEVNGAHISSEISSMDQEADIICFQGGYNDQLRNCPLGSLSDENNYTGELDTTTVIGAIESICRQAINRWPEKAICFIITHKIANGNSAYGGALWSYKQLHDAMIQIFNKYSIPYLDMFNEGGLNSYMDIHNELYFTGGSSDTPDQTHPNEEAYRRFYVPKLIKLFESLVSK